MIHNGQGTCKDAAIYLVYRLAVEEYLAAPGLVEARDELGYRALAAAGGADKGHAAARFERQVEVLDERLREPGVAEGHAAHHHAAGELVVLHVVAQLRLGPVHRVLGVLHDVLDALHVRAHLLYGLARRDQRHRGLAELGQKALKGQDHARRELPVDGQPDAGHHDRAVGDGRDQRGQRAEVLAELLIAHLLRVHAGLIAGPPLEKAVFRAAGLDGLYHLYARHGGARELALVALLHPGDVDALFGYQPREAEIDDYGRHAHEREQYAVTEHHDEIEQHQRRVYDEWGEDLDHAAGNGGVGVLPLLDVARHALGEKGHGQMQYLPHEGGAAHYGQLAVYPQGVYGPYPLDRQPHRAEEHQRQGEAAQPADVLPGQQPVEEDVREHAVYYPDERGDEGGQQHERNGRARAVQALSGKGEHRLRLAARLEVRARLEQQAYAGEGLVEGLHRHGIAALRRVVEQGLVALEAVEHHEVVEVPVYYAGEAALAAQRVGFVAAALGDKAVAPGGPDHVPGVRAVPGDAAVRAHLLQGHPLAVICQHHGEAGGAALQRLHLHDDGDPDAARLHGPLHFSCSLSHAPPQFHRKDSGAMLSTTISASYTPSPTEPLSSET